MVYKVTEETINGIANAIRAKTNSTEDIQVANFAEEILSIQTGENTASAAQSAREAEASAISAASSALSAKEDAALVASGILESESWAIGERDGEPVSEDDKTYHNNAKFYSEVAGEHAGNAKMYLDETIVNAEAAESSATKAAESESSAQASETATAQNLERAIYIVENLEGFNSEAWAVGTRNGVVVTEDDPTHNNNSKYWSDTARATVTDFQANVGVSNVLATATVIEEVSS